MAISLSNLRQNLRAPVLAATATLLLTTSCLEPTEITLHVRTNLPCTSADNWRGVAIYVGKPGEDVEHVAPTLVTKTCDASGSVGSLVVVPSSAKDGELGLRVVAGTTRNPEECEKADYRGGCVVARRALRFTPHTALELDVELAADCVNVACDAEHTCRTGGCITAVAAAQPSSDSSPEPAKSVRCGDNGAVCATVGDICCLEVDAAAQTTRGDCRPAKDCPNTSIVLNCDDDTDCPREPGTGVAGICALSFEQVADAPFAPDSISSATCRFASAASLENDTGLALCEERQSCDDSKFLCRESKGDGPQGTLNRLPGYFWCEVTLAP